MKSLPLFLLTLILFWSGCGTFHSSVETRTPSNSYHFQPQPSSQPQPQYVSEPEAEPTQPIRMEASNPAEKTFTLMATGEVEVRVREHAGGREILRRTMRAGDQVELSHRGAVEVSFTAGERLLIDQDGEILRPASAGTGRIRLE